MQGRIASLLSIGCSVVVFGCCGLMWFHGFGDPVRTTRQIIRVRVVDSDSGKPVAGVTVLLKLDFDRNVAMGNLRQYSQDVIENAREYWVKRSWFSGATDNAGYADVPFIFISLDRTRFGSPP